MTTDFPSAAAGGALVIPDHELLRRIGSGSYGEVWLARSATGTFRAVKVVDRKSARDPRFEREFAGLKKFEPISRAHEGLVDILHVGQNEAAGQLYYVMELADSCASITGEGADGYVPTTLKTKLQTDGHLAASEVARISLALTSALAFLHEQGLIHRDIKPSNIIFVQGQPKLADIGLVAAADETQSFVGPEGYIPPEGPGTPAADVFSLGTVLGELMAKLETDDTEEEQHRRLRDVIERASARNLSQRYQTATEMLAEVKVALG
jgi:serine/threonine protein kinase